MKSIKIVRRKDSPADRTLGTLWATDAANKSSICLATLELPWKNNIVGKSCIPPGKYTVKRRITNKRGKHLIVLGTSPRTLILFHPANYPSELQGCIAPGMSHQDIDKDGKLDVVSSRDAMALLIDFVGIDVVPLEIV